MLARLLAFVVSLYPGGSANRQSSAPGPSPAPAASPAAAPAIANIPEVKAAIPPGKADACVKDCPLSKGPFVSADYASYTKQVGNGYCVPFVQSLVPVKNTKLWKPGVKLSAVPRPDIAKGTAIATFDETQTPPYPSKPAGNHAAFFDGYGTEGGKDGFYVYDQYRVWAPKPAVYNALSPEAQAAERVKFPQYDAELDRYFSVKEPGRRFIKFNNPSPSNMSNNGDTYSTITLD